MAWMYLLDFPDPESADEDGLVGVGGSLHVENLIKAYSMGIYPWTADPVSWWSPDPRAIIEVGQLHVGRSLRRFIKRHIFEISFNRDFDSVIRQCSIDRPGGTWIEPSIRDAYIELHREGVAHSVEIWDKGELVGGLYGVAINGLFAGESMFSRKSNASKLALFALMDKLVQSGFKLFDIQMLTPVTEAMGGVEISRTEYLSRLRSAMEVSCRFEFK